MPGFCSCNMAQALTAFQDTPATSYEAVWPKGVIRELCQAPHTSTLSLSSDLTFG